mmetsp:Transcript_8151/g.30191  ORF Transcript_8151/g.30191 Transcript_8151/m.30191 type:complete len:203 (-) Transcript_8151:7-615(-)
MATGIRFIASNGTRSTSDSLHRDRTMEISCTGLWAPPRRRAQQESLSMRTTSAFGTWNGILWGMFSVREVKMELSSFGFEKGLEQPTIMQGEAIIRMVEMGADAIVMITRCEGCKARVMCHIGEGATFRISSVFPVVVFLCCFIIAESRGTPLCELQKCNHNVTRLHTQSRGWRKNVPRLTCSILVVQNEYLCTFRASLQHV